MKNISAKAINTKKKIYESAKSLFLEKSIDNVTIDSIIQKAGVAKGSFYVYFKSKNELILSYISENVKEVDKRYQGFLEALDDKVLTSELFIRFTKEIANVLQNDIKRDIMKILYETQLMSNLYSDKLMGYDRTLYLLFNKIIKRGIEKEEFINIKDLDEISKDIMISFRGLTFEWCVRDNLDLIKETEDYFTRFIKRIKKGD